jgi:hypothetical protein
VWFAAGLWGACTSRPAAARRCPSGRLAPKQVRRRQSSEAALRSRPPAERLFACERAPSPPSRPCRSRSIIFVTWLALLPESCGPSPRAGLIIGSSSLGAASHSAHSCQSNLQLTLGAKSRAVFWSRQGRTSDEYDRQRQKSAHDDVDGDYGRAISEWAAGLYK